MKVMYGIGKVKQSFKKAVLVIGVFDGLHLGHQQLIRQAVKRAKAIGGKVVVLTFWPHPVHVLHPEIHLPLIISLPHRLTILSTLGVDACVVVRFTKRFSQMTPHRFIQQYIVKGVRPKEVFVGDDFRFGQDRTGTLDLFQREGQTYGFNVNPVRSVRGGVAKISSTHIRELISDGQLKAAQRWLGRPVALMGRVVKGEARGRTLGYPTANIEVATEVILPMGVYAVNIYLGKQKLRGVANIGRRPSFDQHNTRVHVEVHIFHFHKNVYGKELRVEFLHKIREERMFNTKEKLIEQIRKDAKTAQRFLMTCKG